ncbi:MAG: LysE family transporter, partial [Candidatus Sulfotelmatobacter sp.]
MTTGHALLAFTAAAGLLTATPGLDTALVLRTAAVEGPRRAMLAACGICLGCLTWGLAASLGLGALLAVSHVGYNILRLVGACY